MKIKSVDQMHFEGYEAVLEAVDQELSLLGKIKFFLNKEVEIPVTALALSCLLILSTMTIQWHQIQETYPIVIFESGGQYEIY